MNNDDIVVDFYYYSHPNEEGLLIDILKFIYLNIQLIQK